MTATTADRNTPERDSKQFQFPLAASTKLLAGTIACLNSSGYLVAGTASTTLKTVGAMEQIADNSAGAAGDIKGKVRRGCFRFGNSSAGDLIALADIGASCYVVDNQTVAKTNGGSTRSVAGTIRDVDTDGVWVDI